MDFNWGYGMGKQQPATLNAWQKKVANYCRKYDLLQNGDHILLAVSGGVDSMSLLHLFARNRERWQVSLSAAYFDHQLRSQSQAENQFVADACRKLSVPFYSGSADIKALSRGKNVEDVARKHRYDFLFSCRDQISAEKIATAHHLNDQAETVLLHILRGCGLEGLAAIAPKEGALIRPLLFLSKEELIDYNKLSEIGFCQDESNYSLQYTRNKIREDLIPKLKKEFNPQIDATLAKLAEVCRVDQKYILDQANAIFEKIWSSKEQALKEDFFHLPRALQSRLLQMTYGQVSGQSKNALSFEQIEAVLRLKEEQQMPLPKHFRVYRRFGRLYFDQKKPEFLTWEGEVMLIAGKKLPVGESGWQYEIKDAPVNESTKNEYADNFDFGKGNPLLLPKSFLPDLSLRAKRVGDRIELPYLGGSKKVKDIFIDAKIKPALRNNWPLLLRHGEIIAVPLLQTAIGSYNGNGDEYICLFFYPPQSNLK